MIAILIILILITLAFLLCIMGRIDHPGFSGLAGWAYAHRGLHGDGAPENSMKAFQRALKRSKIDFWYTEGFHPHLYLTFALPLSLGYESVAESVADIVADSIVDAVAESVAEAIAVAVAENMPETMDESIADSVTETVTEKVTDSVSEKVVEALTGAKADDDQERKSPE